MRSHKYALRNSFVELLTLHLAHLNGFHPLPFVLFYNKIAHSQTIHQNAHQEQLLYFQLWGQEDNARNRKRTLREWTLGDIGKKDPFPGCYVGQDFKTE